MGSGGLNGAPRGHQPLLGARIPGRRLEDNNGFARPDLPMHFPTHEQKQALLEQVMRLATQRLAPAAAGEAREFIAQYYEQVDPEDLASRDPEDVYGAAMAHLGFARQFAAGMPKLRVYNPRTEEHGWASPHTVIEIVNDDMPFLVD